MTNKEISISIIIATYNAEKYIRECIESIISQKLKSIEIVIVDANSSDTTLPIINSFNLQNLIVISEPDLGIYDALNKGSKLANGKFIQFLGSDDRLQPDFSVFASKLKDPNTIYYGITKEYYAGNIKPDYQILNGKFSKYRLAKYCLNHQAILYPSQIFRSYQYNLNYKVFADYALNLALWGDPSYKKTHYPFAIVSYHMFGFSTTMKDIPFKNDKEKLILEHLGWWVYFRFLMKKYKKRFRGETDFE